MLYAVALRTGNLLPPAACRFERATCCRLPLTVAPSNRGGADYFGRQLAAQFPSVPIGLIEAAVGGTPIEAWLPPGVGEARCATNPHGEAATYTWFDQGRVPPSGHFNGMIAPITPMAVSGVVYRHEDCNPNLCCAPLKDQRSSPCGDRWYHGENNIEVLGNGSSSGPSTYACALQALATSWRAAFGAASPSEDFYFGVYRLATRCGKSVLGRGNVLQPHKIRGTVELRRAQCAARRTHARTRTRARAHVHAHAHAHAHARARTHPSRTQQWPSTRVMLPTVAVARPFEPSVLQTIASRMARSRAGHSTATCRRRGDWRRRSRRVEWQA